MLVNSDRVFVECHDPIMAMIASLSGRPPYGGQIQTGVYEIGHFGSSSFLAGKFQDYAYGVCDEYQQILDRFPEIVDAVHRNFLITLTRIEAAKEDPQGGWRWHKWGDYIGTQKPQCEYIHDEPEIKEVFVFHVYEEL